MSCEIEIGKARVTHSPHRFGYDLLLAVPNDSGYGVVCNVSFRHVDKGEMLDKGDFIPISHEAAQALMDSLLAVGVRPSVDPPLLRPAAPETDEVSFLRTLCEKLVDAARIG